MTTIRRLHAWANMIKQWLTTIEDAETTEHLTSATTAMERLARQKQAAERQWGWHVGQE
jgi:hypothetical protein